MRRHVFFLTVLFVATVLLQLSPARGQKPTSLVRPFGHNVTSTSFLLDKGRCSIGMQALACGIKDGVNIATSPWLAGAYNMNSLVSRFRIGQPTEQAQEAMQVGYFKTFESRGKKWPFEMEAAWATYAHSTFLSAHATRHVNIQLMYYWNDAFPFSLRRPWVDRRPLQVNASLLYELQINGPWYLNAEFGVLGVVQGRPQAHLGMTFEYRGERWLVHGGLSQTGTLTAYGSPVNRFDFQQAMRRSRQSYKDMHQDPGVAMDYSIHPEFNFQYYF